MDKKFEQRAHVVEVNASTEEVINFYKEIFTFGGNFPTGEKILNQCLLVDGNTVIFDRERFAELMNCTKKPAMKAD